MGRPAAHENTPYENQYLGYNESIHRTSVGGGGGGGSVSAPRTRSPLS